MWGHQPGKYITPALKACECEGRHACTYNRNILVTKLAAMQHLGRPPARQGWHLSAALMASVDVCEDKCMTVISWSTRVICEQKEVVDSSSLTVDEHSCLHAHKRPSRA